MAKEEYKALTYVNLPFLDGNGRSYAPGQSIPRSDFDESVELAAAAMPENENITSAQDMIDHMVEWGSISDDADAPLHPAHIPVDPGQPTVYSLAQQAKQLVAQYEAEGKEVPQELAVFAEAIQNIQTDDAASGGDASA
jgi:hypothetical protein